MLCLCLCGQDLDTHNFKMSSWASENSRSMAARVNSVRKQWEAKELVEHKHLRAAGCSWLDLMGKQKASSQGKTELLKLSSS